jgi:hypothetical protein
MPLRVLLIETVGAISVEISDSFKVYNLICYLMMNWFLQPGSILINLGKLVVIADPMVPAKDRKFKNV